MVENNTIEAIVEAIRQEPEDANNKYGAIVARKDDEGVIWVNLAGSENETPTESTSSEVNIGDYVTVEWRNNKLYITGNSSNPAVGIVRVDAVEAAAQVANEAAESAVADAATAREAAESVQGIAQQAQADADIAKTAANTSLTNLSQVQNVLDVVNWVAAHGTYIKATTYVEGTVYYTVTATEVTDPTQQTDELVSRYYELDNGIYVKTQDTEYDDEKTYYIVTGTPVPTPKSEDIGLYYTLYVNDAMGDYIQSHLALTNDGLYVMSDGSEWKVLIDDEGVYIVDPNNEKVTKYMSDITLGKEAGLHAQLGAQKFGIYDYDNADDETYPIFEADVLSGVTVKGNMFYQALPIITIGNDNTNPSSFGTHLVVGENLETPESQGNRNGHITVGAYNDPSVVDFMGYMPEIMIGAGSAETRATPAYFSSDELKVGLVSCSRINSPVEVGQGAGEGIFVNSRGNIVKVEADVNNQDTNITVIKGTTEVRFGVGQGGVNHGIWSENLQGWMIYCDGSDVYVNGVNVANLIRRSNIARGSISAGNVSAHSYVDVPITYGKTFSSTPTVVACLSSASTSADIGSMSVTPINETTSGFTARVFNNSNNQRSPAIRWIATNGG